MTDSFVALIAILMLVAAGFFGAGVVETSIDTDCKNVGKSYTAKYTLTCEAKK